MDSIMQAKSVVYISCGDNCGPVWFQVIIVLLAAYVVFFRS